jgi:hypothetical protein
VEFYTQKDNKFAGMILVDFSEQWTVNNEQCWK